MSENSALVSKVLKIVQVFTPNFTPPSKLNFLPLLKNFLILREAKHVKK